MAAPPAGRAAHPQAGFRAGRLAPISTTAPSPHTITGLGDFAEMTAQASEFLGEPVLCASAMYRRGLQAKNFAFEFGGLLAMFATKKAMQARAGGLPEFFFGAVTATDVVAIEFKQKQKGRDVTRTNVTLESPSEDEKVLIAAGDAPSTRAFLELLTNPSATVAS